ncbi:MAG: methyltransferase [Bacilli bacterium]|jgi:23S rRNA (cytosine1962-C5)-methyltransferase|nr:methyltransferase [Bacilli bacterium]
MKTVNDFKDYQLLDMQNGQKLEKWNQIILIRPDPQIIWEKNRNTNLWSKADAVYNRSNTGGGNWKIKNSKLPNTWQITYQDLVFNLKLMGFKHTGLFPEQAYNWNLIRKTIKEADRKVKVLNLFAYTGGASIAALKEGAEVVHVDSSRGMIDWAKENVKSNHLENKPIRFFVDDVLKFVRREIRRGNHYDIILMDPPSFGRGSKNEIWNIEKDLFSLVELTTELLSEDPLLFVINSYSTGLSKTILENILNLTVNQKQNGQIESDELGIRMKDSNMILPCGLYARWEKKKKEISD